MFVAQQRSCQRVQERRRQVSKSSAMQIESNDLSWVKCWLPDPGACVLQFRRVNISFGRITPITVLILPKFELLTRWCVAIQPPAASDAPGAHLRWLTGDG